MADLSDQLRALGFVVDSSPLLRASIVAFQRRSGLVVDGIAGPRTLAALERATADQITAGLVSSAAVTVHDRPFVAWFEDVRRARPDLFPYPLRAEGFSTVFGHTTALGMGLGLSAREFVGLFGVFYNETGGTLRSVGELGGPGYCFGTNGGRKAAYNARTRGNRVAGDQLAARGILRDPAQIQRWNGTSWPNPPEGSELYRAALECDFYKYRGHGICQITWRDAHKAFVDPALERVGLLPSEEMTTAELDAAMASDPAVYCLATALYFHDPGWAGPALAALNNGDFTTLGRRVSGSTSYASLFAARCTALLDDAAGTIRELDRPAIVARTA